MAELCRASLVALLLLPSVAMSAPRMVRVAVMDFRPLGTEQAKADLLSEIALTRASSIKGFQVIGRSDIATIIGFEKQKQVMGCTDDYGCLAEIGGALGVDYILVGSLGRLGKLYRIDLKLVDAKKAEVKARIGVSVNDGEEELVEAVEKAVEGLLKSVPPIEERAPPPVVAPVVAVVPPAPAKPPPAPAPPPSVVEPKAVAPPPAVAKQPAPVVRPSGTDGSKLASKSKALGWTAVGAAAVTVGLGGFAVFEGFVARGKYADANAMVGSDGAINAGASAADYQRLLSEGDDAKRTAMIGGGAALGAAVVTGIVGYIAYRQTGEVGPFRF